MPVNNVTKFLSEISTFFKKSDSETVMFAIMNVIKGIRMNEQTLFGLSPLDVKGMFYKLVFNVRPYFCFAWMSSRLSHRRFLSFIQSRSPIRSTPTAV